MKTISKRDIKIFFLGMGAMLLIEVIYDWDATVGAFRRGFSGEPNIEATEKTK